MKKTGLLIAALIALEFTLAVRAAEPEVEFVGVMGTGNEIRVALGSPGHPAQWVLVGQKFGEFAVEAYESNPDIVVLSKGGRQLRLPLKEGKVRAGAVEPAPEIMHAILENLRQLGAWADQYYLENGRNTATLADIVRTNPKAAKMMSLQSLAGEDYSQIKFEQGKPISVTTAGGFTISHRP
jgi:hypothetical protein